MKVRPSSMKMDSKRDSKRSESIMYADEDAKQDVKNFPHSERPSVRGKLRAETTVYSRAHYRRGTTVINTLEKRAKISGGLNEHDSKLLDKMKSLNSHKLVDHQSLLGIAIFDQGSSVVDDPFAVVNMPVDIQLAFRRKLFTVFSGQLLGALLMICGFTYSPGVRDYLQDNFATKVGMCVSFGFLALTLLLLWSVKYVYPVNFVVLIFFTGLIGFCGGMVGAYFDTTAAVFTFADMLAVALLITYVSTRPANLSIMVAGAISYGVVAVVSVIIYGLNPSLGHIVPFVGCLVLTGVLTGWFCYDARCLCIKMSPDEYMQGVVLFYSDMVLFLIFASLMVALMCIDDVDMDMDGGGGGRDGGRRWGGGGGGGGFLKRLLLRM